MNNGDHDMSSKLAKNLLRIMETEQSAEVLRKSSEDVFDKIEAIRDTMREYGIEEAQYDITSEGYVNIRGDVDLSKRKLTEIPIKFGYVTGSFCVYDNELTSLKNCPYNVDGDFIASNNKIEYLFNPDSPDEIYFPKLIKGNIDLSNNLLKDTRGLPNEAKSLNLSNNKLQTLKNCTKIIFKILDISNNTIKFNDKILDKYGIKAKTVIY